jgi:Skp family chaperone for outer membrane proteins
MVFKKALLLASAAVVMGSHAARAEVQAKASPKAQVAKSQAHDSDLNIAWVDSLTLMRECEAGKIAAKAIEAERDKLTKELQAREQKIAQDIKEFQAKASTLSPDTRKSEEERIMRLRGDFEGFVQKCEEQMRIAMQAATEDLAKDIEEVVAFYAQNQKLDAVLDTMTGRVIWSSGKSNITQSLVARMDERHATRLAQGGKPADQSLKVAGKKAGSAPAA